MKVDHVAVVVVDAAAVDVFVTVGAAVVVAADVPVVGAAAFIDVVLVVGTSVVVVDVTVVVVVGSTVVVDVVVVTLPVDWYFSIFELSEHCSVRLWLAKEHSIVFLSN